MHRPDRPLWPDVTNLRRAGPLLAASWYMLCGADVSWPLEPARYDLVVTHRGAVRRVQVKTTTVDVGTGGKVYLSTTSGGRRVYTIEEVDDFFVIDADLNAFIIPIESVAGRQAIHLNAYRPYLIGPVGLAAAPFRRNSATR